MEDLLRELMEEVRTLNRNIESISDILPLTRSLYDLDDLHEQISDIGDAITGPLGYHLGDLHSKLDEAVNSIASVEAAIDAK